MKKEKLLKQNGKEYWRSLDQLADTPEFRELVQREFPEQASELSNPLTRRNFLNLMGASIALAGLASCRRPVEKIIPYVIKPEEIIPGVAEWYATTMPMGLNAYGMLAKSHEGHPTKIEGNEKHPSSLGSTNSFMQSAILGLYDPDRSKLVMSKGKQSSWNEFVAVWRDVLNGLKTTKGEGLAILSESFSSPTLARLQSQLLKNFPAATWATYDAVSDENIFEGVRVATGRPYVGIKDLSKAEVIVALDSDFLHMESDNIVAARGFAHGRRVRSEKDGMNRLYVAESSFSVTGGMADHRLRIQSRQVGAFAGALAKEMTSMGVPVAGADAAVAGSFDQKWISAAAKDLIAAKGKSLVVAGPRQPAAVHALVFAMNDALGNIGSTVQYREPTDAALPNSASLVELVKNMNDRKFSTLLILGGNPAYNAPVDVDFGSALAYVANSIHVSGYYDETSAQTTWHIPQAHFLESWGDARSTDGTASVVQPLIEPLYNGKTAEEVVNLVATGNDESAHDIVRETWKNLVKGDFEKGWRLVLHDGVLGGSAVSPSKPKLDVKSINAFLSANPFATDVADINNLEVVFKPSTSTFDGRFANNGWLQELPDPVTKITWDNVALVSKTTADALKLSNGLRNGKNRQPVISLQYQGREMEIPVWVQPGQADYSVAIALGYGRKAAGRVGDGVGSNSYGLRTSDALYFGLGARIALSKRSYLIASVQDHGGFDGDALVDKEIAQRVPTILREGTLSEYREHPDFAKERGELSEELLGKDGRPISIYNAYVYDKGNQWGMNIDLNACIGCNACTIACQNENNIPVVGKEQVSNGREMHWIRLDRYYSGNVNDPNISYQPVACQHCETAPCEQVCPVAATVHDSEGLNVMVYNRCVGTRYCANNCPYKVRRFNFLTFNDGSSGFAQTDGPEVLKMSKNPDVTVRMRGVMEKCTYCVQRISGARIAAKKENREIRDGEVKTACQQACPTQAIVFGNINDPESQVSKIKKDQRGYDLLSELNLRPRTSYLARLRNPNPELEDQKIG